MLKAILIAASIFLLSACVYEGHHPNGVPHQNGGFCPPGQAKKGRC